MLLCSWWVHSHFKPSPYYQSYYQVFIRTLLCHTAEGNVHVPFFVMFFLLLYFVLCVIVFTALHFNPRIKYPQPGYKNSLNISNSSLVWQEEVAQWGLIMTEVKIMRPVRSKLCWSDKKKKATKWRVVYGHMRPASQLKCRSFGEHTVNGYSHGTDVFCVTREVSTTKLV